MKVLVTGANGFIGKHLMERLTKENIPVAGLDLASSNEWKRTQVNTSSPKIHRGSILDDSFLRGVFDIESPTHVIHLAAVAEPKRYVQEPQTVLDVNLRGSLKVADLCKIFGSTLLFSSSSEIYGKNESVPLKESSDRILGDPSLHRWQYGSSKAVIEHLLFAMAMDGDLSFTSMRFFNVYGPELEGRVVKNFVSSAVHSRDLVVNGSGEQIRSFTYIKDAISAIFQLLQHPPLNDAVNIGDPRGARSVKALAETVIGISNSSSGIVFGPRNPYGQGYEDCDIRIPSIEKLTSITGWEPQVDLEDGLREFISYEKSRLLY